MTIALQFNNHNSNVEIILKKNEAKHMHIRSWTYGDRAQYAELCLCGALNCRAFIAQVSPIVMRKSIKKYTMELKELESHNAIELERLENLTSVLAENKRKLTRSEREEAAHLREDHEDLRYTMRKYLFLKASLRIAHEKLEKAKANSYNQMVPLPSATSPKHLIQVPSSPSTTMVVDQSYILESRLTRALQTEGLPLHLRVPFPLKENEDCSLLPAKVVEDILKLLEMQLHPQEDLLTKVVKGSASLLWKPMRMAMSFITCRQQQPPKTLVASSPMSMLHGILNKALRPSHLTHHEDEELQPIRLQEWQVQPLPDSDTEEDEADLSIGNSNHHEKNEKEGEKPNTSNSQELEIENAIHVPILIPHSDGNIVLESLLSTNPQPKSEKELEKAEEWGDGLFTQDEILRVLSWCNGNMHARGDNSPHPPWPSVLQWSFWLHKACRQPTDIELASHKLRWTGITTKTLRAAGTGLRVNNSTVPSAKQVAALLSDVLTFIPYRFGGSKLVESKTQGNIWRIGWNKIDTLPGNPLLRTAG